MKRVYTPVPTNCVRCWQCCITTKKQVPLEIESKLPLTWQPIEVLLMCPLLGVSDKGLPTCLIHLYKPTICLQYHCEVKKYAAEICC
jgi:hypothetical protein